jgi:hypothetical protein
LIKDPTTGEALFGLRDQEIEFARTIPQRNAPSGLARLTNQNNYIPAGPNNNGGRTRAIAYDVRYNGTSNRVLMAGGVSGGLFRSTDGGAIGKSNSGKRVHNVSSIAQDPRSVFKIHGMQAVENILVVPLMQWCRLSCLWTIKIYR